MQRRTRYLATILTVTVLLAPTAALACGGLVGENGTIQLGKTTTLAAYTDGVERYITGFTFSGEGESVGSIVPLPDVPTSVERGGDWTLQRLVQEITPVQRVSLSGGAESADFADEAEVLLETTVDALDITVLRGGGDQVGKWALDNGFFLPPDSPEVLDFYAERSPIFMAAKFDATRAAELGQGQGDSTPIMATIPTDDPWVPLRILSLGLEAEQQVEADVFLLTDQRPDLLAGGPGLTLQRSDLASSTLLADLRSDERMDWVPNAMWLSYLQLDTRAGDLDYDLAVSTVPERDPSLLDAGIGPAAAITVRPPAPAWPLPAGIAAAVVAFAVLSLRQRRRTSAGVPATS